MKKIRDSITNNLCVAAMVVVAGGMVSCASSGGSSSGGEAAAESGQVIAMSEGAGTLALEKKFLMKKEDMKLTKEGLLAGGGKRSQYEGKKQVQFGGEWGSESYQKQEYEKKSSWWRRKKADVKDYSGSEDGSRFQTDSRYANRNARQSGQESRFANADARTGVYEVDAANEARRGAVKSEANAYAASRGEAIPDPVVIDQDEYGRQSIQKTRSLLGRDD